MDIMIARIMDMTVKIMDMLVKREDIEELDDSVDIKL